MKQQYKTKSHLMALKCKWKAINLEDRVKLVLKILLRGFGIKKKLYLCGYYLEDNIRHQKVDNQIYIKLSKEQFANANNGIALSNQDFEVKRMEKTAKKEVDMCLGSKKAYIALVCQNLDKGGLEEVIAILARGLRERKIPVKVICIQSGGEVEQKLQKEGFEVLICNGDKERLKYYCENNRPLLANTHYILDGIEIFYELKIPVVEVIHNMYVFQDENGWKREKEKSNYIEEYIAVSDTAKNFFCKKMREISPNNVNVIGNTWNFSKSITKSRKEVRNMFEISENTFVCTMVGSIDPRKNQMGVLRAWDLFQKLIEEKAILLIVGSSTDYEYEGKIERLIKERNLSKSVIFIGQSQEVYNLLNASDVFVLDSYYEGWSVSATEALFCGIPIIHSDCGSGSELTANGKNGILISNPLSKLDLYNSDDLYYAMHTGENQNIEELVYAMLKIYNHRDFWKNKKEQISTYAKNSFNLNHMIDSYLEVFQRVMR